MLHIILMILKILGILILSILGLGLCIGLLVLFCPIRYYLEGSIYGKPEGQVRISWLLRLICATISYKENRVECKFCIFGIRLKKRKKKELQIEQKARASFFKKQKKHQEFEEKKVRKEIDQVARQTEKSRKIEGEEEEKKEEQREKEIEQEISRDRTKETDRNRTKEVGKDRTEEISTDRSSEANKEKRKEITKTQQTEQNEEEKNLQKILQRTDRKDSIFLRIKNILARIKEILIQIKRILIRIKESFIKIKGIPTRIREILFTIKEKIQKFFVLLRNLNKKKQMVLAFIRDEKNKIAFRYAGGKFFRLLCYILPGKVTLKLHYGFEDPAATGILTGMIFMFYPKGAEKFQLMPDFENRILEGELTIKGRVQLVRVFCTLLSIYFHKECNRIIKTIIKR